MGEKLKGTSQAVSWEHLLALLRVALEHGTLSFSHVIICWTSALSQYLSFLSLLWVTWHKSQYPLHSFGPCHVLLLCLSVQGKYPPRESAIPNILPQNLCQSMSIWSTNYISMSFCVVDGGYIKALLRRAYSCRPQHIIQELDLETS